MASKVSSQHAVAELRARARFGRHTPPAPEGGNYRDVIVTNPARSLNPGAPLKLQMMPLSARPAKRHQRLSSLRLERRFWRALPTHLMSLPTTGQLHREMRAERGA